MNDVGFFKSLTQMKMSYSVFFLPSPIFFSKMEWGLSFLHLIISINGEKSLKHGVVTS